MPKVGKEDKVDVVINEENISQLCDSMADAISPVIDKQPSPDVLIALIRLYFAVGFSAIERRREEWSYDDYITNCNALKSIFRIEYKGILNAKEFFKH